MAWGALPRLRAHRVTWLVATPHVPRTRVGIGRRGRRASWTKVARFLACSCSIYTALASSRIVDQRASIRCVRRIIYLQRNETKRIRGFANRRTISRYDEDISRHGHTSSLAIRIAASICVPVDRQLVRHVRASRHVTGLTLLRNDSRQREVDKCIYTWWNGDVVTDECARNTKKVRWRRAKNAEYTRSAVNKSWDRGMHADR